MGPRKAKPPGPRTVTGLDTFIGNRLRARRLEMHMSQSELADKLGVSFQQVQKYEKGVNRIGAGRLQQIARVLETEMPYFMSDLGGKQTVSKIATFLATVDGVAINEAMINLSDAHRRGVIDLARSLVRAYGV